MMTEFFPKLCNRGFLDRTGDFLPDGWYIATGSEPIAVFANVGTEHSSRFNSREECQRAIDSLTEAGIETAAQLDHLENTDMERLRYLLYRDLFW